MAKLASVPSESARWATQRSARPPRDEGLRTEVVRQPSGSGRCEDCAGSRKAVEQRAGRKCADAGRRQNALARQGDPVRTRPRVAAALAEERGIEVATPPSRAKTRIATQPTSPVGDGGIAGRKKKGEDGFMDVTIPCSALSTPRLPLASGG